MRKIKEFLLEQIENKKAELSAQINRSHDKLHEFFWTENPKRQAKQNFLQSISDKLSDFYLQTDNSEFTSTIGQILSNAQGEVFQSFFVLRAMGDIVEAIKAFANHYEHSSTRLPTDTCPLSPCNPVKEECL